jgi:uncharacterized membrane protein
MEALVKEIVGRVASVVEGISISPTWNDIGQVGAIAVIRTFLNYFLEKDAKEMMEVKRERETRNTQAPPAQA